MVIPGVFEKKPCELRIIIAAAKVSWIGEPSITSKPPDEVGGRGEGVARADGESLGVEEGKVDPEGKFDTAATGAGVWAEAQPRARANNARTIFILISMLYAIFAKDLERCVSVEM